MAMDELEKENKSLKEDYAKLQKKYLKAMDGVLLLQKMLIYMQFDEEHASANDFEAYQQLEEKYKQLFD